MIYRVLKLLSTGHEPGQLVDGERFKPNVLAALLRVQAVSEVRGPPLTQLPGWLRRAERLEAVGIETVTDFLKADPDRLKRIFGHKKLSTITRWRNEARRWITVDKAPKAG